jgi:hypothetical protein
VSSANPPPVACGNCGEVLDEPPNLPQEARQPCPKCGALHRTFSVGGSIGSSATVSVDIDGNVVIRPPTGVLRLEGGEAEIKIEQPARERLDELEDAGYSVSWSQLSPGGAWMVSVFDRDGNSVDTSIQDDPADALLAIAESLLPPSE